MSALGSTYLKWPHMRRALTFPCITQCYTTIIYVFERYVYSHKKFKQKETEINRKSAEKEISLRFFFSIARLCLFLLHSIHWTDCFYKRKKTIILWFIIIFGHALKVMIWYSMIVLCIANIERKDRVCGWFNWVLRWLWLILSLPFWSNQIHDKPTGMPLISVYFYRHILQLQVERRSRFYLDPTVLPSDQHWIRPFHRIDPFSRRCIWCNIGFGHRCCWNSIF